VNCCFGLLQQ